MRSRSHRQAFFRSFSSASLVCGVCLLIGSVAQAQLGQGGTGQTQTGGGTTAGGTGGTGGTGGSLGGVAGQAQFAAPQFLPVGESIDATGGTGFAGRGDASQNFVGGGIQATQGQNAFGGNRTAFGGGANQFSQLNRGQGQTGRGGVRQQPTGPSRSEMVRPRYRLAFSNPPIPSTVISTRLQSGFRSLAERIPEMAGVDVSLDAQGNATLTGTTVSASSARLAAALARLEPGVRRVDNQLQVNGSN